MVLLGVTAAVAQNPPADIEMFPMELIPNLMDLGGGEPLFKEDLSNATFEEQGWAFENGNLVAAGMTTSFVIQRSTSQVREAKDPVDERLE